MIVLLARIAIQSVMGSLGILVIGMSLVGRITSDGYAFEIWLRVMLSHSLFLWIVIGLWRPGWKAALLLGMCYGCQIYGSIMLNFLYYAEPPRPLF